MIKIKSINNIWTFTVFINIKLNIK